VQNEKRIVYKDRKIPDPADQRILPDAWSEAGFFRRKSH
jgi:hypothetical protein